MSNHGVDGGCGSYDRPLICGWKRRRPTTTFTWVGNVSSNHATNPLKYLPFIQYTWLLCSLFFPFHGPRKYPSGGKLQSLFSSANQVHSTIFYSHVFHVRQDMTSKIDIRDAFHQCSRHCWCWFYALHFSVRSRHLMIIPTHLFLLFTPLQKRILLFKS